MIKNVLGDPGQPLAVGVTVSVALAVNAPLLDARKDEISPVPLAGKPITGAVFVQV